MWHLMRAQINLISLLGNSFTDAEYPPSSAVQMLLICINQYGCVLILNALLLTKEGGFSKKSSIP